MNFPHNVPAFRCHRYATCNESNRQMVEAGMKIASNVCTNLEIIPPFIDRLGLIQVPIYFEDGGYLWTHSPLRKLTETPKRGLVVMNIHPMHFVINTPSFDYMVRIKKQFTREKWKEMSQKQLDDLRYQGEGIRGVITKLIDEFKETGPLVRSLAKLPRFSTKIGDGNVLKARHRSKSCLGY